jgi:rhodanese-related sulfurtransferase
MQFKKTTTFILVLSVQLIIVFLINPKPSFAYLSPSTLQLIQSAITPLLNLTFILITPLAFFARKIKRYPKIFIGIIIISTISLGINLGIITYKYLALNKLNDPGTSYSNNKISYSQCIKSNYINFLSLGSINYIPKEYTTQFVIDNYPFQIINLGNSEAIRFKNEIFINDASNLYKKILIKTKTLGKEDNLIIHCWGGEHSSSSIAQFLAQEGFKNLHILESTPTNIYFEMEEIGVDTNKYFKKVAISSTNPALVRIPKSQISSLNSNEYFVFYKVKNYLKMVDDFKIITHNNSSYVEDWSNVNFIKGKRINFICDTSETCNSLHTLLSLSNYNNIGYIIVAYE